MKTLPAFLLLAACGAGSLPAQDAGNIPGASLGTEDQALSGSRIRARHVVTADGAKGFIGWYDAQLSSPCQFLPASDGQTRCIPAVNEATISVAIFSDPGCSTPAILGVGCFDSTVPYGYGATSTCPVLYKVFTPISGATYYTGTPSSCVAQSTTAGQHLFSAADIAPSTFAAGSFQTE